MPEVVRENGEKRAGRPFPWWCPNCRKKAVYRATMPYRLSILHDGQHHEVEVPELGVPRCAECGELVFDNQADDDINRVFRSQIRLLQPEQIRAGRIGLGLSEKELAARLGVPEATILAWEDGLQIQSRAMDNLLRVYFALPQVRRALVGVDQDPNLGTNVVTAAVE
ncbi:MAG TPA: hypothetical protein VKI65_10475 [Gemmataceae bacterium]|nr:hypothetical protein [Gemmataceae bacterium]